MFNVAGIFVQGAYANNVKCIETNAFDNIIDYSEFISGIYAYIFV